MASVIPDVGGGNIGGGDGRRDGGGCAPSLDGVGSFPKVDNWLGSSSYATQAGLQQPEAVNIKVVRDVQPASTQANENYMNTQESCSVKKVVEQSELQKQINDRKAQLERTRIQREADLNHFEDDTQVSEFCSDDSVHSDGSAAEAVQMEIDCASEEDKPLELTTVVKYVKNPSPTSRCHNEENREIFMGSSGATQVPPQPPHEHQSSHIPASSAPPLGPKTMRNRKTAAPKRGSTSIVSTGPTKSSPAPPRGSTSTRAANAVRAFNAPRTSTGQAVILTGKRKRRPTSKFAAYFSASGNH
ncbi:hypothetical protein ZWY2020_059720 [Hordeum vulgare]|nr:hypothetical protein ZWY2020_059720 [Hordeum vulgare]